MSHFIEKLSIRNFKSIRSVDLDCARINVFVGKPNVGKSNVLEALALFCAPFSKETKFLSEFIRYNDWRNLFTANTVNSAIEVITNHAFVAVENRKDDPDVSDFLYSRIEFLDAYRQAQTIQDFNLGDSPVRAKLLSARIANNRVDIQFKNGNLANMPGLTKKYEFLKNEPINVGSNYFLTPPFGNNLFDVIHKSTPEFTNFIGEQFKEYNLEFLLDADSKKFEVFWRQNGLVYKIAYNLIADTLQRYLFHLAAIESNRDSILLFEEPESHSFPPYVQQLAYRMDWSTSNQFFVATHSPYLLNTLVEESKDVAVFICNYENYETKIHRLTEEDLSDMLNYGIEIFYNLERFLPHVEA